MPSDATERRLDAWQPPPSSSSSCPCPMGSYCDLATNRCVAGCGLDDDCEPGLVCEDRACRDGCRSDADCGGDVCDPASRTCRRGCRETDDCGEEQRCDRETWICTPGCDSDRNCREGRHCEAGECRGGCRLDANCPTGMHCADGECTAGCASAEATTVDGAEGNCADGQSCNTLGADGRPTYECGSPPCDWQCRPQCALNCEGWYACFGAWTGDPDAIEPRMCRQQCIADTDCGSGYRCTRFPLDVSDPWGDGATLCARPCTSDAQCQAGTWPRGECSCGSDGVCHLGTDECFPFKSDFGL